MFKNRRCFVNTQDNWCGNYPNNQVELMLLKLPCKELVYRVAVWGTDDLGMEKDFETNDPSEAKDLYEKLLAKDYVNMDFLKSIGFINA